VDLGAAAVTRPSLDQLLWRVYQESQTLLREAERLDAGRLPRIAERLMPLSRAVEAVEDHEARQAEAEDRAAARMGWL
jgi:hypothetical protein